MKGTQKKKGPLPHLRLSLQRERGPQYLEGWMMHPKKKKRVGGAQKEKAPSPPEADEPAEGEGAEKERHLKEKGPLPPRG